ncbi:anaerobic magnesium-protoporphyrin IX monomethyl ester cyclase [Sideroxyarcus emersonii]|uniref:Anaerobic magnesium-protoporphyrin IX monomethyl ester cyclase n=1 Tax=Sideroxyarcus emersonii TaxID=2764705 RepID=A0AAN1X8E2_9PROT|nr:radical SAM protein [Sideroxyarcus emersonii]BCK86519.1 anaerobic magnesium-protoporphyrin IX monomethyl ester cyclase [Sideroxyarcus emersonii]
MRITFVHPAGFNFVPGQPDLSVLANRMPPIGILSLAAWLDKHGHATCVHDCLGPFAPPTIEENAEIVLATDPELIGFSTTTSGFMDAADMARYIRQKRPDIKLAFGNVHVSSIGAPLLERFPEIDYLCIGEGEGAMLDLADGKPLGQIANLVYRDGGRIVANPRRQRILDLDELPFPAYEKLRGFPEAYHLPLFSHVKKHGATMITSRGCPYTCSFCDRTVFERLYKVNSAQYIYDHMKYLRDRFGVYHINFYDDLFTAQKQRVFDLCDLLIEKPLGMQFNCAIRTGHTSDEMLQRLKRAGALMVSMGIESADPAMMERHKAGVTLDAVTRTVEQIHAAGLRAKGLFIFGMPGETPETVKATSDFILSLDLDEMNMTKFSPLYGAPIWDECVSGEEGEFIEDWRLMNCLNFVFLPAGFASREQMDALYNWHILRFYNSRNYRRRFTARLWQHRWSLWHLLRNLPRVMQANRYFSANQKQLEAVRQDLPRHPRQPVGLVPLLGEELYADKRSTVRTMLPVNLQKRASDVPMQCIEMAGE